MSKQYKTEIEKIRKEYGFTLKQVSEEIGMAEPNFQLRESGKRVYRTPKQQEEFIYRVRQACKRMQMSMIAASLDLEKNTYKPSKEEFSSIEESIEDECSMELHYQPLTNKLFREALGHIVKGKTAVRVATMLEVDEEELIRKLKHKGIEFETGYNSAALTNENKYPHKDRSL